jgi:hypothetical protein
LLSPPTAGTIMLAPAPEPIVAAAVTGAAIPPVEDNSNATAEDGALRFDVASSPVAEELVPAPTIPTTPVATKAKPAPEPEYIDSPEFEEDDEFENDEVEEDRIPF